MDALNAGDVFITDIDASETFIAIKAKSMDGV
jgi:hypothetical protein